MTLAGSTARESDPQLWDRFLKVLQDQGIDQRYWRWYVLRVEQYLKAHRDKPLDQHTGHEVTAYLGEIGRISRLKAWQFRQLVEAIECLFARVVGSPWAQNLIGAIGKTPRASWNPRMPP